MKEVYVDMKIELVLFPQNDILTYSGEFYDDDETPFNPIPGF